MNILLTGGAGYIGSHAAVVLAEAEHNIVILDNFSNSNPTVIGRLKSILNKELICIEGDVRDTPLVIGVLRDYQIDGVMHFAGLKAVGESVQKPIEYYANNVQGTISLLQAMQFAHVKTIVFSSSATVYGQPHYLPIDESHPTIATNPYGRSKLHIEEMLADIVASDSDWRIACLRYFNPVGSHKSGLIGEKPSGIPNNLMPYLAQVASGQHPELSVFGDDYPTVDGTGVRDYIHVMDLAEGHTVALTFLSRTTGWHAINLGTGKGYSVIEMIKAFEKASERQIPYKIVTRRVGDVGTCYSDPRKARELLNWRATRTLDDMCASTWHFQNSQRMRAAS
jgi:UDP-glucose 4-epimerase